MESRRAELDNDAGGVVSKTVEGSPRMMYSVLFYISMIRRGS
jgi:hypothetical protein